MNTNQPPKPARIAQDEKIFLEKLAPKTNATQTQTKDTKNKNRVTSTDKLTPTHTDTSVEIPPPPDQSDKEVTTSQNNDSTSEVDTTAPTATVSEVSKKETASIPLQHTNTGRKVLIEAKNIFKSFYVAKEETKVLKDISVQIHEGDFLIVVGPSGSGKSTFLHIMLGLEIPTSGELLLLGKDLYKDTTEDIRSESRKQHIGMVYQQPNWIKSMSVIENIAFPLILRGYRRELAHEIAYRALQEVHMEVHANQPPTELSGGQQQRISLARCIVHNPEIVVADEPTGNLDYESGQEVMELLYNLNVKDKKTVIMVTHDIEYIKFANCAIHIFDGKVAGYYDKDHLSELTDHLHTKHVNRDTLQQSYAKENT